MTVMHSFCLRSSKLLTFRQDRKQNDSENACKIKWFFSFTLQLDGKSSFCLTSGASLPIFLAMTSTSKNTSPPSSANQDGHDALESIFKGPFSKNQRHHEARIFNHVPPVCLTALRPQRWQTRSFLGLQSSPRALRLSSICSFEHFATHMSTSPWQSFGLHQHPSTCPFSSSLAFATSQS